MATEVESFLRAEEAAGSLLRNVEHLKTEIEGYSRAKVSLEEARSQLASLVRSIAPVADQISTVIQALDKVGTPEILREVAALTALNEQSLAAVAAVAEETQTQAASIRDASAQSIVGIKREVETLGKQLLEQIEKVRQQSENQATFIKRLLAIVLVTTVVAAAGIVLVIKST